MYDFQCHLNSKHSWRRIYKNTPISPKWLKDTQGHNTLCNNIKTIAGLVWNQVLQSLTALGTNMFSSISIKHFPLPLSFWVQTLNKFPGNLIFISEYFYLSHEKTTLLDRLGDIPPALILSRGKFQRGLQEA